MTNRTLRTLTTAATLAVLLAVGGCHRKRKTRSAAKSEDYADSIRLLVDQKELKILHWPNFSDYQPLVHTFYDDRNFEVAWVDNAKPTKQATHFIAAFQQADRHGLNPEDYDASLWPARLAKLGSKNQDDIAHFDAAMTICVMRFVSDLRIGRVNPTHFNFDINTVDKKYDLPEFVSDNAVDTEDVEKLIDSVEPDSDQFRKTEIALAHYRDLAKQQAASPQMQQALPTVAKPIIVGRTYEALAPLAARLALEGDLIDASAASQNGTLTYTPALSAGVQHYQARHGITPDGKLTAQTIASLNVPLNDRIHQLNDSLERWRWLPNEYVNAPLMVNLPEFVLRGYGDGHKLDFTMKVVVGKVVGEHQTPVFTHEMKYLIFRPYWNVPLSIIKKELTPHLDKSGVGYLAEKNFETVDSKGDSVSPTVAEVERGGVTVREKPGPKNSLGLVKFMFPNEYDIYLHSTPAPELFDRSRRDFSHGCVRVQKPEDLAVWVLRKNSGNWDAEKVHEAMTTGEDNHTVGLKTPVPIAIFYLTANVGDDGDVRFFDDIYGYDQQLEAVLAKGMPYPSTQQKVNPRTVFGDTN